MLKRLLLGSAAVLALGACGGTDSSQPSDPGYTSGSQLYCNHTTTPNSSISPTASCNTLKDLPVSGGCDPGSPSEPVNAVLVMDAPASWQSNRVEAALWQCEWTANGRQDVADGTPVALETAVAWMCCVAVP